MHITDAVNVHHERNGGYHHKHHHRNGIQQNAHVDGKFIGKMNPFPFEGCKRNILPVLQSHFKEIFPSRVEGQHPSGSQRSHAHIARHGFLAEITVKQAQQQETYQGQGRYPKHITEIHSPAVLVFEFFDFLHVHRTGAAIYLQNNGQSQSRFGCRQGQDKQGKHRSLQKFGM